MTTSELTGQHLADAAALDVLEIKDGAADDIGKYFKRYGPIIVGVVVLLAFGFIKTDNYFMLAVVSGSMITLGFVQVFQAHESKVQFKRETKSVDRIQREGLSKSTTSKPLADYERVTVELAPAMDGAVGARSFDVFVHFNDDSQWHIICVETETQAKELVQVIEAWVKRAR